MKRLVLEIALAVTGLAASAATVPVDTLYYNIVYKWGFIEKVAGHGTVTMKVEGDTLVGTLAGKSIPWGGRIYSVCDTLHTIINNADGVFSQKVMYENGWYTKPLVGESTKGLLNNPADYVTINGEGTLDADASTMEAITITADMIGFFRLVQLIDFPKLSEGTTITVPITMKGKPDKRVQIIYNGESVFNDRPVYEVVFNYSYNGHQSAYPVTCNIDVAKRIPLSVSADLIIGHLEMVYAPTATPTN